MSFVFVNDEFDQAFAWGLVLAVLLKYPVLRFIAICLAFILLPDFVYFGGKRGKRLYGIIVSKDIP